MSVTKSVLESVKTVQSDLNHQIIQFLKRICNANQLPIIGGDFTFEDFLEDKLLVIATIRSGIPYTLFEAIKEITPFTEKDWAMYMDISTKSLQRFKTIPGYHFKTIHSEKILELAEVTKMGMDVFGDLKKFKLWLNTPNFAFGNNTPFELLKDSYGKEMVMGELVRINHGIFV